MPPSDQLIRCLRTLSLRSPACPYQRTFSTTPVEQASTVQQRRRHRDPYALAQAKARKAANLSRQEVLKKERAVILGDPVRGTTTAFVKSFDTGLAPLPSPPESETPSTAVRTETASAYQSPPGPTAEREGHVNFFLNESEIRESLRRSHDLTIPVERLDKDAEQEKNVHTQDHANATEALNRIASLSNASSKDRLRVNIQRCVDAFGRHNTDQSLPPRAPLAESVLSMMGDQPDKTPRAGPDTGSSEVQIAVLTAKIRTLADFLETRGKTDKVNKRNLRLLVHRRQKLLLYLRRKERGGPRWQNIIDTLGLTEGTWRGEISL